MGRMWWTRSYSPFESRRHLVAMVSNFWCLTPVTLTIILVITIIFVIAVVKLNAGSTERDNLLGIVCLAHARQLVPVSAKASVALVGDEHNVGADRLALPGDIVTVNVLCQSGTKGAQGEHGGSILLHFQLVGRQVDMKQ